MNPRNAKILFAMLALVTIAAIGCDRQIEGDSLPSPIGLDLKPGMNPRGFVTIEGKTNLPEGSWIFLRIEAGGDLGSDLRESALASVSQGAFRYDSYLGHPVLYGVTAEFSKAANPDRPRLFGQDLKTVDLLPGCIVQKALDGSYKVVATAQLRAGTPEQARAVAGEELGRLGEVADRLEYDRAKLEKIIGSTAPDEVLGAMVSWARIRRQKARELHVDRLGNGPLYAGLGLEIRDAWNALDEVFLWHLARIAGNTKEAENFKPASRRLERDMERIRNTLGELSSQIAEAGP